LLLFCFFFFSFTVRGVILGCSGISVVVKDPGSFYLVLTSQFVPIFCLRCVLYVYLCVKCLSYYQLSHPQSSLDVITSIILFLCSFFSQCAYNLPMNIHTYSFFFFFKESYSCFMDPVSYYLSMVILLFFKFSASLSLFFLSPFFFFLYFSS
jgi:hypothetical protein